MVVTSLMVSKDERSTRPSCRCDLSHQDQLFSSTNSKHCLCILFIKALSLAVNCVEQLVELPTNYRSWEPFIHCRKWNGIESQHRHTNGWMIMTGHGGILRNTCVCVFMLTKYFCAAPRICHSRPLASIPITLRFPGGVSRLSQMGLAVKSWRSMVLNIR